MKKLPVLIFCGFFICCAAGGKKNLLVVKTILPKELKEISGITAQGPFIWAITDKPKARVFKLDPAGRLLQTVDVLNMTANDVEAVASDAANIYLGDIGDNVGDRTERKIIKIATANITNGTEVQVNADTIVFTFPDEGQVEGKKQNNFDCESLLSFKDSLYVFTKDREDKETRLYVLPKTPGNYVAKYISTFNSEGLVTDAACNKQNNEVALIGYHKGHSYPFIFVFSNFRGNDFFSGEHKKIELANKPWDWQLEGITYGDKNTVYFSCEGTKQVAATFYGIKRENIFTLNKTKEKSKSKDEDDDGPELTKKAHLKM